MKVYSHKHLHLTRVSLLVLLQQSLHRKVPVHCYISPVPPHCGSVRDIKNDCNCRTTVLGFVLFYSHITLQKKKKKSMNTLQEGYLFFLLFFLLYFYTYLRKGMQYNLPTIQNSKNGLFWWTRKHYYEALCF